MGVYQWLVVLIVHHHAVGSDRKGGSYMKTLASATLEDIEILILGGAWIELPSEIQQQLRIEIQDIAKSWTRSWQERNAAFRLLQEHDLRYSQASHQNNEAIGIHVLSLSNHHDIWRE